MMLSASGLSDLELCPRRYEILHRPGLGRGRGTQERPIYADVGAAVHDELARIVKAGETAGQVRAWEQRTLTRLRQIATVAEDDHDGVARAIRGAMAGFDSYWRRLRRFTDLCAEIEFSSEVCGAHLSGRIDVMARHPKTNERWIVDWKLGIPPVHVDVQLGVYALAVTGGQLADDEHLVGVAFDLGRAEERRFVFDRAKLRAACRHVEESWHRIEEWSTSGFPAHVGFGCGSCPALGQCRPGQAWLENFGNEGM